MHQKPASCKAADDPPRPLPASLRERSETDHPACSNRPPPSLSHNPGIPSDQGPTANGVEAKPTPERIARPFMGVPQEEIWSDAGRERRASGAHGADGENSIAPSSIVTRTLLLNMACSNSSSF